MKTTMEVEASRKTRIGFIAFGVAMLAVLVLMVFPRTLTVARAQFAFLFASSGDTPAGAGGQDMESAAAVEARAVSMSDTLADPFDSKLAAILHGTGGRGYDSTFRHKLEALAADYPTHRKEVYGHILRYATSSELHLGRDAMIEKYFNPTSPPLAASRAPSAEALQNFLKDAAAGEKADPTNCYFPAMHALGLFAVFRDSEGTAMLEHAARLAKYDDYANDEVESKWRAIQNHGALSTISHVGIMYSNLFPQYAQMRAMARLTNYLAVKQEVQGHKQEGLALRIATLKFGSQMRVQSRCYIGNLVGAAICAIATSRVGGANNGLTEEAWKALTAEQKVQKRTEAFSELADSLNHPEYAEMANNNVEATTRMKKLGSTALEDERNPLSMKGLLALLASWRFSMMLLANLLTMGIICGAALALRLIKKDSGDEPLAVIGLAIAIAIVLCVRMNWAQQLHASTTGMTNAAMSGDEVDASAEKPLGGLLDSEAFIKISSFLISFMAAGIFLIGTGIVRLCRPNQGFSVLARCLQTGGAYVTLLLAIAYCLGAATTADSEVKTNAAIRGVLSHEGRYFARVLHDTWPEE